MPSSTAITFTEVVGCKVTISPRTRVAAPGTSPSANRPASQGVRALPHAAVHHVRLLRSSAPAPIDAGQPSRACRHPPWVREALQNSLRIATASPAPRGRAGRRGDLYGHGQSVRTRERARHVHDTAAASAHEADPGRHVRIGLGRLLLPQLVGVRARGELAGPRRARSAPAAPGHQGRLAPVRAQLWPRRYRPAARQSEAVDTSTCHLGFRCVVRGTSPVGR